MASSRYRLLALDVDRTLLPLGRDISSTNKDAILKASRAGCEVILVSGRRWSLLAPLCRGLEVVRFAVASDGVVVKDVTSGNSLHRLPLDPQLALQVRRLLPEHHVWLYHLDAVDGQQDVLTHSCSGPDWFTRMWERYGESYVVGEPDDLRFAARLNLMWTSGEMSALRAAAETLKEQLNGLVGVHTVTGVPTVGNMLDVFHPDASKWSSVQFIAAELRIADEEILAMGDDTNDIAMLLNAGLGIAVSNAPDDVRAAADIIGPPCEEDAVAWAIRKFVL